MGIRRFFKRNICTECDRDRYFQNLIKSFNVVSFVDGYDDCVRMYFRAVKRKVFTREEVVAVVDSQEFAAAFFDLDRYDIDYTREYGELSEFSLEEQVEDDRFDMIYFDNYVYLRDLVDSLLEFKGKGFYQMLGYEPLLCAEYSTMRRVGFVLHFLINYAWQFEDTRKIVYGYTLKFKSEKSLEFIRYLKERIEC